MKLSINQIQRMSTPELRNLLEHAKVEFDMQHRKLLPAYPGKFYERERNELQAAWRELNQNLAPIARELCEREAVQEWFINARRSA